MTIANEENVGLAFGLVIGAGLATALGASVVFFPSLIHLASRRTLAGALGFSAGVMTYVSFVEIFNKSKTSFQDSGLGEEKAYAYATVCFFGGVSFMVVSLCLEVHECGRFNCLTRFLRLYFPIQGVESLGDCFIRRTSSP
jgi:ZIP family zinc transporter